MKEGGEGDSAGQGIERANFLAGRGGAERASVGCALLVMELLAATQDKCPTYVESGEGERELHCGNGYKCRE